MEPSRKKSDAEKVEVLFTFQHLQQHQRIPRSGHQQQHQQQHQHQQQRRQSLNEFDRVRGKRKSCEEQNFVEPVFRIGGKTDPERFSTTDKQFFIRIGFHDDERSDTSSPIPFKPRDRTGFFDAQRRILMERFGVSPDFIKVPRPVMSSSSSSASASASMLSSAAMRSTLSPVREVTPSTSFESIDMMAASKKSCSHECHHQLDLTRVG